jgi:hypothetical protein
MVQNMKESERKRRNVVVESDAVVVESDEKDSEDERPPTCVVCLRRQVYWTACVRLSCVLLFLFLLLCLNRSHVPYMNKRNDAGSATI